MNTQDDRLDPKPWVLIVDDEPDIRELLDISLRRMGLNTRTAVDLKDAKEQLAQRSFAVCMTDLRLPDGDGLALIVYCQEHYPSLPVAVLTAHGSMDVAIQALKAGAFDFVNKPIQLPHLRNLIAQALKVDVPAGSVSATPQKSKKPAAVAARSAALAPEQDAFVKHALLGESSEMQQLMQQIKKIAISQAAVAIQGESGTGKERVARLIHGLSPRQDGPFVAVNCGAIPTELMESEFFGHKKGSFTGAHEEKIGLFQAAEGGTLFLDEVADLPLNMQVKLLRVIQERSVRPVGATRESAIDVRLLSATHKQLTDEMAVGRFRQDLFYRLQVIALHVPPLRTRGDDILLLTDHLVARLATTMDIAPPRLTAAARAALLAYDFPGNVRELENMLERALTLSDSQVIDREHLFVQASSTAFAAGVHAGEHTNAGATPSVGRAVNRQQPADTAGGRLSEALVAPINGMPARLPTQSLEVYLADIERRVITDALDATRWNRTAAAKRLGTSFRSLRYRLKKLGMDLDASES